MRMKTKTYRLALFYLAAALAFPASTLFADDDDGDDGGQGTNENCQGGHIDGSETLIASVDLLPTTNAPSGAGGLARLISDNEDGVVTSSLSLTITGLDAGVYSLS